MFGFNYVSFKEATKRLENERYARLEEDVQQVRAVVEKALTMFLESTANTSRVKYQGIDM